MSITTVTLESISDLKNHDINNTTGNYAVEVLGYYKAGDGGGGSFYWDPSAVVIINFPSGYSIANGINMVVDAIPKSLLIGTAIKFTGGGVFTLTANASSGATSITGDLTISNVSDNEEGFLLDNDGTILEPDYSGYNGIGRWIRQDQPMVSVRWFGAKGINTDDTVTIQNTINYCRTFKKVVYIPQGDYKVSNQFTVPSTLTGVAFQACLNLKTSISIIGDGIGKSNLFATNTADTVFASNEQYVLNVTIEGFSITGPASASADGCGIRLGHEDTSSGQVFYESRISDVKITGFGLNAIRTPNEFNNEYNRIIAGNCYGHILYIEGDTGTQLNNCRIEEVPTANRAGYRLLRGGILSACNGTKAGSDDDHLWGSFGNWNGLEPENTSLGDIGGRYQLNECNIEHWVTQAIKMNYSTVRVLLNCPKIFQNKSSTPMTVKKGNIVVTPDIHDAGKLRIWNMEFIPADGLLNDAHIRCFRHIDVLTDSDLTIYANASGWEKSFKAGRIYGNYEYGDPGFAYLPNLKSNNLVVSAAELGFVSGKVFMNTFQVDADATFSKTITTGTNDFVNIYFAYDSTVSASDRHLFMNSIAQVGTSDVFITELNSVNKVSPESGTISITKTGTKNILIQKTAGSESLTSGTVFLYIFGKFTSIE